MADQTLRVGLVLVLVRWLVACMEKADAHACMHAWGMHAWRTQDRTAGMRMQLGACRPSTRHPPMQDAPALDVRARERVRPKVGGKHGVHVPEVPQLRDHDHRQQPQRPRRPHDRHAPLQHRDRDPEHEQRCVVGDVEGQVAQHERRRDEVQQVDQRDAQREEHVSGLPARHAALADQGVVRARARGGGGGAQAPGGQEEEGERGGDEGEPDDRLLVAGRHAAAARQPGIGAEAAAPLLDRVGGQLGVAHFCCGCVWCTAACVQKRQSERCARSCFTRQGGAGL